MSRFRLTHSEMPLRARELALLPKRRPRPAKGIEAGLFHNAMVFLHELRVVPLAALVVLVAALDVGAGQWLGAVSTGALVCAQAADMLLLAGLSRKGISFAPLQHQWLAPAVLRLIGALAVTALAGVTQAAAADLANIAVQAIGVALVIRAYWLEPSGLGLSRIELEIAAFRAGAEIKLLHVADVHLERRGRREDKLVELARRARPDAILYTGDFLNLSFTHDPKAQSHARDLWNELSAIAPTYAVAGSPPVDPQPVVAKILADGRATWLRDEARALCVDGHTIQLIGVTCTHDPVGDGERLRCVSSQARADLFTILLYHAPDLAPQAAALNTIDVHLAGHTHGGQIRLWPYGALVTSSLYHKQLEMGLYQLRSMLLYVSRGVGLEGKGAPRARLQCPPEVTLWVLRGPQG